MDADHSTVISIILGGVLGAVLSPACEALVNAVLKKEKASTNDGIMLLCFSNAVWLISMLISALFKTNSLADFTLLVLYIISALLLISSFHALRRPKAVKNTALTNQLLFYIIGGNLMWLISDISEIITTIFDSADFIYLTLRVLFTALSFVAFAYGILMYFSDRYATK